MVVSDSNNNNYILFTLPIGIVLDVFHGYLCKLLEGTSARFVSLRFIISVTSDGDERGKRVRPQAELDRGQHASRSGVSFSLF